MKRLMAVALTVMLAAGSSGCISIHKETHEAKRGDRYSASHKYHAASSDDCHDTNSHRR